MSTSTRNSKGQFVKTAVSDAVNSMVDETTDGFDYSSLDLITVKYPIVGAIVNLLVTGTSLYTTWQFTSYIVVAATMMTGSGFLAFLLGMIAGIISIVYSLRAGAIAGRWIATGQFETDFQSAKTTVVGWFKKDEAAHV